MAFTSPRSELGDAWQEALQQVDAGAAPRDIEDLMVEFKQEKNRNPNNPNPRNREAAKHLAEALGCMANSDKGGVVIVGVGDDGQRIGTDLDVSWLVHRVFELSDGRLLIAPQEVLLDGVRLLVLVAPESPEPVVVSKRLMTRVGANCVEISRDQWERGRSVWHRLDWSAEPSSSKPDVARGTALEIARTYLAETGRGTAGLHDADDLTLLRRIGVVVDTADGEYLTNAGALLFVGTPPDGGLRYIWRPALGEDSETRVVDFSHPLLEQLARIESTLDGRNRTVHLTGEGFSISKSKVLPPLAVREAIVNGLAHRNWRMVAPTLLEHTGDTLQVTSPGGFIGGVSPENILTHPPVSANPSLAKALAKLAIAEQEGIGVDRMMLEMLSSGRPRPEIRELEGPYVRVTLVGKEPDRQTIALLDAVAQSLPQDRRLESALVLDHLTSEKWIDQYTASDALQSTPTHSSGLLEGLSRVRIFGSFPFIERVPTPFLDLAHAYVLSEKAREMVWDRLVALTFEEIVTKWVAHRGKVGSAEAVVLCGVSQPVASGRLKTMSESGLLSPSSPTGRGRGFHYLPM